MTLLLGVAVFLGLILTSSAKSFEIEEILEKLRSLEGNEPDFGEPQSGVDNPLTRGLEKRGVSMVGYMKGKASPIKLDKACLFAHNELRKKHGAPSLKWDKKLAASAQKWADEVAKRGGIEHSLESIAGQMGENVAYKGLPFTGTWGPAHLIYLWYSEYWNPGFNFKDPENAANKAAGHFTQIVWKGTKNLGCGIGKAAAGNGEDTYLVCQYYPGANMQGQYGANVGDLNSGESVPKHPLELAYEGCCDYDKPCTNYAQWCSAQQFVRDFCCDSCGGNK